MKKNFRKLSSAIDRQNTTLIFFIGLSALIFLRLTSFDLTPDDLNRLVAAINLNQGNGYSMLSFDWDTCSFITRKIHHLWPISTSYIVSKINLILQNPIHSYLTLELITSCFYLFIVLTMIKAVVEFKFPKTAYLIIACNPTLSSILRSTDLFAITLFLSAIFSFLYFEKNILQNKIKLVIVVFLFTLPSLVRFGYYPLAYVPLFYLFYHSFSTKSQLKWRSIFISIATPTLIIGWQIILTQLKADKTSFIESQEFTVYFENLILVRPFFLTSILNAKIDHFAIWFQNLRDNDVHNITFAFLRIFAFLLEIAFVYYLQKIARRNKKLYGFNLMLLIVFLINVSALFIISVITPQQTLLFNNIPYKWSFVSENRYYAPAIFSIFFLILNNISYINKNLIFALLTISILFGGVKWANRMQMMNFDKFISISNLQIGVDPATSNNVVYLTDNSFHLTNTCKKIASFGFDNRMDSLDIKKLSSHLNHCFPKYVIEFEYSSRNPHLIKSIDLFKKYLIQDSIVVKKYEP